MKTPAKKLSLKKETLRPLDTHQIEQLDGVVGGTDPITISISVTISISITVTFTRDNEIAAE